MHFPGLVLKALALASGYMKPLQAEQSRHQDPSCDFYARNLKTITSIYNLTVFPNNVPIITSGPSAVPPGLFATNATGRASPLGNFTGFEDSIEYFFALAPIPDPPAYAAFSSAKIMAFSSSCPEVAASVVYFETSVINANSSTNGQYLSTLKQIAFWRFDDDGAVSLYDAWVPNLTAWGSATNGGVDLGDKFVQYGVIANLCPAIQQLCTGVNQQYSDIPFCIAELSAKPFGNSDEAWGDNVVCRTIHAHLAKLRPDAHCPHVGPTGGMKCVNEPYNHGYFNDAELFGMPEGEAFVCPH